MSTTQSTQTTPCEGASRDTRRTARPVYDSRELEDGQVLLQVALPGVRKEDASLTTEEQVLSLSAARCPSAPGGATAHRTVDRPSHYELKLRLDPSLDPGGVSASLEHGVLSLRIPRRPESRPREIAVN
jgi:HSP20 family molecular chaperone IbpA